MNNNDLFNLTNLKYFCDAVKFGGVSAAAKANFVTQSAISQGIAKLEKTLCISLIAHHPKCFRVTPEGQQLFEHGMDILKKTVELKDNLKTQGDHNLGSLDFACTYSFALALIPQHLKKFRSLYPHTKINFRTGKNDKIKEMIKQGIIDFGILPDEGDLDAFQKVDVYSGFLKLYASKNIPKKEQKSLGFIMAEPGCKERILLYNSYIKKYGKEPQAILEVSSWEVMTNLTVEGMGISYLPDYIMNKREHCLQEVDLGLELHRYRICAIFPKGMQLRKSSTLFLSFFANL